MKRNNLQVTGLTATRLGDSDVTVTVAMGTTHEEMTHEHLQHLAAIVRDSDDAIIGKTLDGIITSWNGGAERIYGYTAEEAIGRTIAMIVPPDREDELPKILSRLSEGEGINHYSTLRVTKDGRLVNVSLTVSPIRDPFGVIIGIASIGRDVTKEKEAEDALRESAKAYKLLMEQASDAIFISYPDQPLVEVNQRASEMLGYSREELLLLAENNTILSESYAARHEEIQQGKTVYSERPVRRKDGTEIVTELSSRRLDDGRIVSIARDITDRKRGEQELRESEARYRAIVEDQHLLITRFLRDGTLTFVNEACSKYWGQPREQLLGRNFLDLMSTTDRAHAEQYLASFDQDHPISTNEQSTIAPDGAEIWLLSTTHALFDEEGSFIEFQTASVDITERKMAVEGRIAKEAAQAANQAKSEFLSQMSHELRTPLNAILGFSQLLQMEDITPNQQESVAYITTAGQHLLTLINEVLDIARIEAGKFSISMEPVFLRDVLEGSLKLMQPLAARRHITVNADLAWMGSCYVMADHQRLQQVVLNLLANAIKYNHEGGTVTVVCSESLYEAKGEERQPTQPLVGKLRVMIGDTGPGLAPEKMMRLFTAFERLGADQFGVEGTGLGLALSKRMVEAMGGSIGAESELGKGSTFWVELALAQEHAEQQAELELNGTSSRNITRPLEDPARTVLYIDDNLPNSRLVERILQQRPAIKFTTATHGRTGLEMAREHRPDLILLDLHLPDLMGNDVVLLLRADPRTSSIPIIVLSADANRRQINELMASGVQDYLTKPLDVKQFLKVLDEIFVPVAK